MCSGRRGNRDSTLGGPLRGVAIDHHEGRLGLVRDELHSEPARIPRETRWAGPLARAGAWMHKNFAGLLPVRVQQGPSHFDGTITIFSRDGLTGHRWIKIEHARARPGGDHRNDCRYEDSSAE
jgi:hypothetical protein